MAGGLALWMLVSLFRTVPALAALYPVEWVPAPPSENPVRQHTCVNLNIFKTITPINGNDACSGACERTWFFRWSAQVCHNIPAKGQKSRSLVLARGLLNQSDHHTSHPLSASVRHSCTMVKRANYPYTGTGKNLPPYVPWSVRKWLKNRHHYPRYGGWLRRLTRPTRLTRTCP